MLVVLIVASVGAGAQSFSILGRTISLSPPPGYCTPGASTPERELTERSKASLPVTVRLVYWAAPCKDLEELRTSGGVELTEWLQVQVLAPGGTPKLISSSREAFLAGLAKLPATKPEEIQESMKSALGASAPTYKELTYRVVGRDGNAVYATSSGTIQTTSGDFRFRAAGAITLINSIPISVLAYGKPQVATQRLMAVQRDTLTSLLTSN